MDNSLVAFVKNFLEKVTDEKPTESQITTMLEVARRGKVSYILVATVQTVRGLK